jgi:hypothetical protein
MQAHDVQVASPRENWIVKLSFDRLADDAVLTL